MPTRTIAYVENLQAGDGRFTLNVDFGESVHCLVAGTTGDQAVKHQASAETPYHHMPTPGGFLNARP